MLLEISEEEISLLVDLLAEAGVQDKLPSELLPYF